MISAFEIPVPNTLPEGHLSLEAFLKRLQGHISKFDAAWVTAEVVSATMKDTALYLDLAENNAMGKPRAKVRAQIWMSREAILDSFRQATGGDPKKGMNILCRLRATLHPVYGLSLDIEKIDPSYTIGDIERSLAEMRQKLINAGLYDLNRRYSCPTDFHRVAVISPVQAAALGDFRETADRLQDAGLCHFEYRTSSFTGSGVAEGLKAAMIEFVRAHKHQPYCALCIIRGGGSVADLAELNQLQIARAVCHVPMPVLTGIGHERDNVLLDDIASRRFDTPSKLVLHIEQAIYRCAQTAGADWQFIRSELGRSLGNARAEVEGLRETVSTRAVSIAATAERELESNYRFTVAAAAAALPLARLAQTNDYRSVCDSAHRAVTVARRTTQADMEQILGLGPSHTLARGFAIVRDAEGRVVTNRPAAIEASELAIEFADGRLKVRRTDDGNG